MLESCGCSTLEASSSSFDIFGHRCLQRSTSKRLCTFSLGPRQNLPSSAIRRGPEYLQWLSTHFPPSSASSVSWPAPTLPKTSFFHVVVPVALRKRYTSARSSNQSLAAQTAQAFSCRGCTFVLSCAFAVQSLQEFGTEYLRKNWKLCAMLRLAQGNKGVCPASSAI